MEAFLIAPPHVAFPSARGRQDPETTIVGTSGVNCTKKEQFWQRKHRAPVAGRDGGRRQLKRPSEPRSRLPDWVRTHEPEEPVVLDGEEFVKSFRKSRRGAAPGPSDMCAEHLRPLLDRESDVLAVTMFANFFARGQTIVAAVRLGRMTALQKPDGGVRGIVVGDYFRRLVSRTLAKQFAQKAEDATSLF